MLNLTSHKEYIASRTPVTHPHEVYRLSKISISRCFLHTQAEMITQVRYILQQKQSNIGYYKTNINYTSEIYYHPHES